MSPESPDACGKTFSGVTLFVSNVDAELTEERLLNEFNLCGEVLNMEVTDGAIKSANVTFLSPGEAQKAVEYLNGKILAKNTLYVGLKRRRQRRISKTFHNRGFQSLSASWGSSSSGNGRPKSGSFPFPNNHSGYRTNFVACSSENVFSSGDSLINFKQNILARKRSLINIDGETKQDEIDFE